MAMIHAARNIFSKFIPDVYIFTDHKAGPQAGKYAFFLSCLLQRYNLIRLQIFLKFLV
jgi:hypothetical protein